MSTINERISLIVEKSGLTKTAFAKRVNVSQQYISKLVKTGEPSELFIDVVCREFNVNEEWLRTGEGKMLSEVPAEDEFFKAATQISKSGDKFAMQAIIEYWKLDDVSKEVLRNYIYKIAEKSRE